VFFFERRATVTTYYMNFKGREISFDGLVSWYPDGDGACPRCGKHDACAGNFVEITAVRDGMTQLPLPELVGDLTAHLEKIMEAGTRLCLECLPKLPREIIVAGPD
jgi:hypothetical protein